MGPEVFAKIGIASALMMYFQLLIDYGFIISATETVTRNKNDKNLVCRVFTSVTILKICLAILSASILWGIVSFFPKYQGDNWLYALFLLSTILDQLAPDFVYRGMEDVSPLAARSVVVRLFFTVCIFIFLQEPKDYLVIPILNCLGSLIYLVWSFWDMHKRFGVTFAKTRLKELRHAFASSSLFFISRAAGSLYTAASILILNATVTSKTVLGNFSSADRLISLGKMGLAPIGDSVYPYMITHRDFKLIKKIIIWLEIPIIIGCVIVGFYASEFCALIFGQAFYGAGPILVAMLPGAALVLPNNLFGFPVLAALGATKHANYSIIFAAVVHVINLCIFFWFGWINAVSIAALVSVAMGVDTLYRIIASWYFYKKKDK